MQMSNRGLLTDSGKPGTALNPHGMGRSPSSVVFGHLLPEHSEMSADGFVADFNLPGHP
jgi:hypothetical protein